MRDRTELWGQSTARETGSMHRALGKLQCTPWILQLLWHFSLGEALWFQGVKWKAKKQVRLFCVRVPGIRRKGTGMVCSGILAWWNEGCFRIIYISVLTYKYSITSHIHLHCQIWLFSPLRDILVLFHHLQMSSPSPVGSKWLLEHGILFSSGTSIVVIKYPNKRANSFVHVFAWY